MDNRIDGTRLDDLTSGIRTDRLGTGAGEGHGETRPRTGPATEDRVRARCDERRRRERSPDGPHRHDRQEGCLDRPLDPLPTRVESSEPLPAAYRRALDDALERLAIDLGPAARAAIDGHVRLLLAWNAAINLTAIRDPTDVAIRHVADSLSALPILVERGIDRFVDLGSGGGFPGLPLAAALPAIRGLLVESVGKKARFLETAVAAVGLLGRVEIAAVRAETLAADPHHRTSWSAVTVRAVAALPDLVELALPLLRPGGVLIAWKSGDPGDPGGLGGELRAAVRALATIGDGRIAVRDAQPETPAGLAGHRLVVVERGRRPIAPTWPRDSAARRRRPW